VTGDKAMDVLGWSGGERYLKDDIADCFKSFAKRSK